ncbi:hypothetical protein BX600DRAFT_554273 [Xylariales sp. PMI_506]|nr:hypothetical protein BX600DRAFT_554273 [Xylariales sp. PMI_506]
MALPGEKRSVLTDVVVYAYGDGISGLPVYADENGLAVLSADSVSSSTLSNLTWSIDTTGSAAWNASFSGTTAQGNFYIINATDGYAPTGFNVLNNTAPSNALTTGFVVYGSQVMYSTGSTYLAQFWAQAQNDSETLWNVVWNSDSTTTSDIVPITLKIVT